MIEAIGRADAPTLANRVHWATSSCTPDTCPGAEECCYANVHAWAPNLVQKLDAAGLLLTDARRAELRAEERAACAQELRSYARRVRQESFTPSTGAALAQVIEAAADFIADTGSREVSYDGLPTEEN